MWKEYVRIYSIHELVGEKYPDDLLFEQSVYQMDTLQHRSC